MRKILLIILACFLAIGCIRESFSSPEMRKGEIALLPNRSQVITKSGDNAFAYFDEGTKYVLYVAKTPQTGELIDWTNPSGASMFLNNREGTDKVFNNLHYIQYYSDDTEKLRFSGEPLNFYGATFGTEEKPVPMVNDANRPLFHIETDSQGDIPDLLISDNQLGVSSYDGYMPMKFKHALSRLVFSVSKEDESGTPQELRHLTNVRITKLEIVGTRSEGVYDLEKAQWSYTGETVTRKFWENTEGVALTNTLKEMNGTNFPSAPSDAAINIFPNDNEGSPEQITLKIYLKGLVPDTGHSDSNGEAVMELPIHDYRPVTSDTPEGTPAYGAVEFSDEPMVFKSNHEYHLSLCVMTDEVRLIAVTPKIYEWIPVPTDAFIAQPVTFGGVMWMDRNLGATSSDPVDNYNKSVGFYYELGRNIPYIFDFDKYEAEGTPKGFEMNQDGGIATNNFSLDKYLFTYDATGDRVYGINYTQTEDYDNLAISPGDLDISGNNTLDYRYSFTKSKSNTWATVPANNDLFDEDPRVHTLWNNTENQPCPKGWRIPDAQDFTTFLPDESMTGSISHYMKNGTLTQSNTLGRASSTAYFIFNWLERDSYYKNIICTSVRKGETTIRTVYMIKNFGNINAYMIRIQMLQSNYIFNGGASRMNYYKIDRYPATSETSFESGNYKAVNDSDVNKAEWQRIWDNPSESMTIPATGFIYPDIKPSGATNYGIVFNLGNDVILGTTTSNVLYFRTNYFGAYSTRNCVGRQIRCVRNLNAQ